MYEEFKGYVRNGQIYDIPRRSVAESRSSTFTIMSRGGQSTDHMKCAALASYKKTLVDSGWSYLDKFPYVDIRKYDYEADNRYRRGDTVPEGNVVHVIDDSIGGMRERWIRNESVPNTDVEPPIYCGEYLGKLNGNFEFVSYRGSKTDVFARLKTLYRCVVCKAESVRPFTAKHETTKHHLGEVSKQYKAEMGAVDVETLFKNRKVWADSSLLSHLVRYEGYFKINGTHMVDAKVAQVIDAWLQSGQAPADGETHWHKDLGLKYSTLRDNLKLAGIKPKHSGTPGICCKCNEPGVPDYLVKTVAATMEFCRKHGEMLEVVLDKMDEMETKNG